MQGNPYKFGLVGASDTHVAAGSFDENNYQSVGLLTPAQRGSIPVDDPSQATAPGGTYQTYPRASPAITTSSASGLAGVWANNTATIFVPFAANIRDQRTTHEDPVFAGHEFDAGLPERTDVAGVRNRCADGGRPCRGRGRCCPQRVCPQCEIRMRRRYALKSSRRIENAWGRAGLRRRLRRPRVPDAETHRCPTMLRVLTFGCSISAAAADELSAVWVDPDYRAGQETFYYARVANPTCRWSTWMPCGGGCRQISIP